MLSHEATYKGFDGTWSEFECVECGWHKLISADDIITLDHGDQNVLHCGASEPGLNINVATNIE
jgi:hypothetical protein